MRPLFMNQLLELRKLLQIFEIVQETFVIHLSEKDALELLKYNNRPPSSMKDLIDGTIYNFKIKSAGEEAVKKTFIEIRN